MIATQHETSSSLSERDLEIYAAVRVDGRRQVDVAAEFGITQGRVSQILRRVNQWRARMGAAADLERRDQRAVDRWLDAQRIEKLYEETMELYRRSCKPRRRERKGKNRHGEWTIESIDHQPGNLQCLKLATRLIELKSQLGQESPPSEKVLEIADEQILYQRLTDMRVWAEQRGHVTSDLAPAHVVQCTLDDLLGRERHRPRPIRQPAAEPDDPAANEPASISDISATPNAEKTAEPAINVAVSVWQEATSADAPTQAPRSDEPHSEANNSEFFVGSANVVPRSSVERDWPPGFPATPAR